ncbi:206_t:CDS:2, partial [Dentiscutata erythropus]
KKIQEAKLVTEYGTDLDLSEKLRYLLVLAFLPPEEILAAFNILKKKYHQLLINNQPLYLPELWSIYSSVESGFPRTQNKVEGWHNRWNKLVSGNHLGVYSIIEEMQKEQQRVDCQVERILNGEQRPTPKKKQLTVRNEL